MKKWFIVTIFVTILLFFASGHKSPGWTAEKVQTGKDITQLADDASVSPGSEINPTLFAETSWGLKYESEKVPCHGERKIDTDFGNIPLYFIPNKGQMNEKALFCAKTKRYTLWLTKQGLVFDSNKKTHPAPTGHPYQEGSKQLPQSPHSPHSPKPDRDVSRMIFLNANKQPVVVAGNPTDHKVNYFKSKDKSQWRTNIPTSRAVSYKALYKNIDLKVYGIEKQIEYDWVVNPGADPGDIRFQYQGVKQTSMDEQGNLVIRTGFGEWMHQAPTAYQEISRERIKVAVHFKKTGENTYGFKVGEYNKNYPLIIDPLVLAYSTYLGGSEEENIWEIAVGAGGSVYVAGGSFSPDYPTANAYQGSFGGGLDGVVTRFTPDGTGLVYSTYLGGSGYDGIDALYLDSSGAVYVGGTTDSNDFPLVNPFQANMGGGMNDAFIAKLSANGSSLLYSTYLGGYDEDSIYGITLDSSGAIYVSGVTLSDNFPVQNAFQSNKGYDIDAFVTKLTPAGDSLVYSTFLGGGSYDYAKKIGVTASGEAVVAGNTESNNFPVYNAYQGSLGGVWEFDGFITRLSADGSSLVYSTYLGGSESDTLQDLALDSSGAVYLVGTTSSSNFPITAGAYQTTKKGYNDGFVTKLAPDGLSLVYSTFLGGTEGGTNIVSIDVDSGGSAYVAGSTASPDFPVLEPFQYGAKGNYEEWMEAFITRFNAAGSGIIFSSYLGGYNMDVCTAVAIDGSGAVYMTGTTFSDDFPTYNAFRDNKMGTMNDSFVTKLIMDPNPSIDLTSPIGSENWAEGTIHNITWNTTSIGMLGDLFLFYSTDNGSNWYPLNYASPVPDTGSYAWTVPSESSNQCLVKIQDYLGNIMDVSDSVFTISSLDIAVTTPNNGEEWFVNSTRDITWVDNGSFPNVSIDYSIDGGGNWIPVATNIPNTKSYSWTIPDTVSTNCLVRVSDPSGTPSDTSDAVFTISPPPAPFIEVTAPDGGEGWTAGFSYDITWDDSTTIPNVSIDYSIDNGSTWTPVAASITNTGSYSWTVPDTPSIECLVRVSDPSGTPTDVSDAVFTIIAPPFPSAERNALIALYNSTNGDSWTRKDNWRKPGDPTKFNDPGTEWSWWGVTVSGENVFRFILNNNNLTGTIPDLSALVELETLNLRDNQLSGTIPASLAALPKLKYLALDGNNLESPLPDLGTLPLLYTLYLDNNNFTGGVPAWLTNCASLAYLYLDNNSFSGTLPDLSGLTSIKSIILNDNALTGTIPAWLNNLATLQTLSLNGNQFTGTIPDLSGLSALGYFSASDNQLTGSIPTWMTTHTNLAQVILENNQLSGIIPDLTNMTKLYTLRLSNNEFTGPIPNVAGLTQLYRLELANNHLSGSIPGDLGQVTYLRYLSLKGNQLTGSIPLTLADLTNLVDGNSDFTWNGLYTDDTGLRDFLNTKQTGNDWESTQTIAPTGVSTGEITETSIKVSWTPIVYQGDSGGYKVYYSTTAGSGYVLAGTTADKTVDNFTVTGLNPGTMYYFVVETFTSSHADNSNTVTSEYSTEVSASTLESRTITVITPNGPETWEGNIVSTITWNSTGSITDVKIEYSLDSGGSWNTITASTPNSGSYDWTVPNTPSAQCLVRITDTASAAADTSDGVFTIQEQRTVTVIVPNGTEEWLIGNRYDITWNSTGAVGTVSIDYSTDNGSSWNSIISSTSNTGTYNWTIPNTPSDQCLVRISDTAGPAADVSDGVFRIPAGISTSERDALIALYNATNGDSWTSNTNWRKPGEPTQFNDPGTENTWYGVTCNAENTNVVQIQLNDNNLNGTLPSQITDLTQLTSFNVRWNQLTGNIPDLSSLSNLLELNLSGNQLTGTIPTWLTGMTALTGLYLQENLLTGTIPDLSSLTNLTQLNLGDNQLAGEIPAWLNLMVNLTHLDLYSNQLTGAIPDLSSLVQLTHIGLGGNTLSGGIPAWLNDLANLREIFLSSASLTGTIPDLSNLTQLEIFSAMNNNLTGSLSGLTGLTQMQWLYLENNQLSGEIPADFGNLTALGHFKINGNMFSGEIPTTLTNLTNLEPHSMDIRWNALQASDTGLRDFLNSKQFGGDWESSQTTAPTGISAGEETQDSVKISWTPISYQSYPGGYRVYYSTTSGSGYTLAGTTADKTVDNYTVTGLDPTTQYYFVVESVTAPHTDNQNTVVSAYSAEVSATTLADLAITITAPNGPENWGTGSQQSITWFSGGTIVDVKIEYSTDNGGSWSTVIASTPNTGSYSWTVPETPSTTCLVRISDAAGPTTDVSDSAFTIFDNKTLTVTAPDGGETWQGNTLHDITWNSTGSITAVKIEYYRSGIWYTIADSAPNTGTYSWMVPGIASNYYKVRITDANGTVSDESNDYFTVSQPSIVVTSPNGGQEYYLGTTITISYWTSLGVSTLAIDYSIDGGNTWINIESAALNTGYLGWTIPNTPSTNCLVKVYDPVSGAFDISDNVFTIKASSIPASERAALIALYNSTDGDNWVNNNNWRDPGDPAQFNGPGTEHTWFGLTLTPEKDHIVEIEFYMNGLNGTLPVQLNDLTWLTKLDVASNQLTGPLPDLSGMQNLADLFLGGNPIGGPIPTWINNIPTLTRLHLDYNQWTGTIPDFSNLTQLTQLLLDHNQLTGTIPASLNNLVSLTALWLHDNQLTGSIPNLGSLTALTSLNLYSNQLTGSIPPELGNLTALENLNLNNNQFSGSIPPELGNLINLDYFHLENNQLSGSIPAELGNLVSVKTLDLDSNNLVGSIPTSFTNLTSLSSYGLGLSWNGLYTNDSTLKSFLDAHSLNWESTQTIAPKDLAAGEESQDSVTISWTPIDYVSAAGGYRVYYSTTSGSDYTLAGTTTDKTEASYTVTGLNPETTYYFVVKTFTDPHTNNQNTVVSEYSAEVTASTTETPTLTVTAPNNGENWEGGTGQTITWNSTGNITDVKIEYSTDNGGSWSTVIASTPNNGSYIWMVPNTPSTDCLVKIADTGGLAEDTSDVVFTIAEQRTLNVTAPNGTETWEGGSNQNITWNSTGDIPNVKIEYSTDNGTTWNTITASTANNNSYSWTVVNTPSTDCLVKISDTAGSASDTSNGVFTITEQRTLTVMAPNGTENWEGGTDQNITWNSVGDITNVKIEYSTDNGASWNIITASTANSGSYSWTVANTPSTNCLVRISDTAGPASDTSNGVFTIAEQRTLTVSAPDGTENWEVGTNQTITWNSTGSISNVMIEYSADNGSSWNTIIASTANSGSYSWTVANTPSTNCLVRISDTAGPASDTSNGVFTIAEQRTLTVMAPNGTENWEVGTNQTITWNSTGSIANVLIEYSTDNGSSWNTIIGSTANSGSYNWTVPNTPSANCLVKISDTAGPASDTSNGVFTIAEQRTLTVTAPNGTENWEVGTNQTITWNSTGSIANVLIEYSTDNGSSWNTIIGSTANSGSYNWTVPYTPSANCLVKVSDTTGLASDTSNGVFTIAEQRTLTVIAPNGTENWEGGTTQTITWNSTGSIANVMIEYSTNSGSSWNTIISSTANSGSYNWTVPNTPSGNCLVKVSDTAGPASDTSNGVFTIAEQRTLTVIAPNGTENWEGGTTQTITWNSTGSIVNVMIEYSTNSGSSWNTIIGSTANSGSYNWTVPNTPSGNCLVKVSDTTGPASDTSNGVFTIAEQRTLTVIAPNGTESWEGGTTQAITWNSTGSIFNVMIEYSTNSGSSWNTIIASTANDGSFNWTVANTPSSNCLVRISDTTGPAFDTSNGVFTIAAQRTITVTAPNDGEMWQAETNQTITWISTGNIVDVRIEYSTDGGSSWNTIASSTANSGSYSWDIPNDPSDNCLVKISDTAGPAWDQSDAVFTMTPPVLFETGVVTGVASSWQTVNLQYTYTSMVVVCSSDLGTYGLPVVCRVRNALGNSFEVMVQNPKGTALSGHDVHYIVIEEGVYNMTDHGVKMEAVKATSTITARSGAWTLESRSYSNSYNSPVVLGQVMTYNDARWSVFWACSYRATPPTSSILSAGKHVGQDTDITRNNETIGYIVLEAGSGSINSIPYTAAVGADIVRGPDNTSTGYTYNFSTIPTASTAIMSAAGMDGGDGGWPVFYGSTPLTSSSLTMVFDEDQIKDSERKHGTEQVAYAVFGTL